MTNHPTFNAGAKLVKWPFNISPDQIDAGKGYHQRPCAVLCAQVNVMKAELPTNVLLRIVCAMYHHNNIRPRRRLMLRPRHARLALNNFPCFSYIPVGMAEMSVLVEARREHIDQLGVCLSEHLIESFDAMYNEASKMSKGKKVLVSFSLCSKIRTSRTL